MRSGVSAGPAAVKRRYLGGANCLNREGQTPHLDGYHEGHEAASGWVHKTANVLNKMPKSVQPKAKSMLNDIWMAQTRKQARQAFDLFIMTFKAKYSKAVECLARDREVLLAFYDFPAEHWIHLRTDFCRGCFDSFYLWIGMVDSSRNW